MDIINIQISVDIPSIEICRQHSWLRTSNQPNRILPIRVFEIYRLSTYYIYWRLMVKIFIATNRLIVRGWLTKTDTSFWRKIDYIFCGGKSIDIFSRSFVVSYKNPYLIGIFCTKHKPDGFLLDMAAHTTCSHGAIVPGTSFSAISNLDTL